MTLSASVPLGEYKIFGSWVNIYSMNRNARTDDCLLSDMKFNPARSELSFDSSLCEGPQRIGLITLHISDTCCVYFLACDEF